MKGCPIEVEGPLGPWWKKFNDTAKLVQVGDTCERVVELWGEPDVKTRPGDKKIPEYAVMGMYIVLGEEQPDEMWGYTDPYHKNRLYILEIRNRIVLQKYRSSYVFVEPIHETEASR